MMQTMVKAHGVQPYSEVCMPRNPGLSCPVSRNTSWSMTSTVNPFYYGKEIQSTLTLLIHTHGVNDNQCIYPLKIEEL